MYFQRETVTCFVFFYLWENIASQILWPLQISRGSRPSMGRRPSPTLQTGVGVEIRSAATVQFRSFRCQNVESRLSLTAATSHTTLQCTGNRKHCCYWTVVLFFANTAVWRLAFSQHGENEQHNITKTTLSPAIRHVA